MMTKLTIFLVAVVLAAVLEVGLSRSTHNKNWNQFSGNHIGFATGKCSALSGILPEPQSGCCGRHAGANEDNEGSEEDNTDDGNNENDDGDNNNDVDDDENSADNGSNGVDDGDNNVDDGSNGIDDGDNDLSNSDEDNNYEDGNGHGPPGWINDIGDIFESVGSIYDDVNDIFDRLGFADDSTSQFTGFSAKHVKENASDVPPDGYITAGKRAGLRQYPWLVHLNMKVREMFQTSVVQCGGSLISPRFVLTAAHCVDPKIQSYNDISIFLAEYNTNTYPTDCVGNTCVKNVVMHPEKIIKHKDFEPNLLANDIALMRLRGSAPYTEYIRPICLPSFNIDVPKNNGAPLSIAGWGAIGTGRQSSPIKLTGQVKLVGHSQCQRHYNDLTKSHICAVSGNGQDTCQGDSGGPIMAEHEGNYYIVGIVSGKASGTTCGSSVPTLYTNVYTFRKWIRDNMRV